MTSTWPEPRPCARPLVSLPLLLLVACLVLNRLSYNWKSASLTLPVILSQTDDDVESGSGSESKASAATCCKEKASEAACACGTPAPVSSVTYILCGSLPDGTGRPRTEDTALEDALSKHVGKLHPLLTPWVSRSHTRHSHAGTGI